MNKLVSEVNGVRFAVKKLVRVVSRTVMTIR